MTEIEYIGYLEMLDRMQKLKEDIQIPGAKILERCVEVVNLYAEISQKHGIDGPFRLERYQKVTFEIDEPIIVIELVDIHEETIDAKNTFPVKVLYAENWKEMVEELVTVKCQERQEANEERKKTQEKKDYETYLALKERFEHDQK